MASVVERLVFICFVGDARPLVDSHAITASLLSTPYDGNGDLGERLAVAKNVGNRISVKGRRQAWKQADGFRAPNDVVQGLLYPTGHDLVLAGLPGGAGPDQTNGATEGVVSKHDRTDAVGEERQGEDGEGNLVNAHQAVALRRKPASATAVDAQAINIDGDVVHEPGVGEVGQDLGGHGNSVPLRPEIGNAELSDDLRLESLGGLVLVHLRHEPATHALRVVIVWVADRPVEEEVSELLVVELVEDSVDLGTVEGLHSQLEVGNLGDVHEEGLWEARSLGDWGELLRGILTLTVVEGYVVGEWMFHRGDTCHVGLSLSVDGIVAHQMVSSL